MASAYLLEDRHQVEIPLDVQTLEDFRRWARSDAFPEHGRIDFIDGRLEIDMAAEDIFCHGAIKVEIVRMLSNRIKKNDLGHLLSDSTRISSVVTDLSSEPDIVFVSHKSFDSGEVRLIPKAGQQDRYVEIEGPVDLVVEIVSDASVSKDRDRLPPAYFKAGVKEYWLVDGRGPDLYFQIFARGAAEFEPAASDADGFQPSAVMGCAYRLDRSEPPHGRGVYDLVEREIA